MSEPLFVGIFVGGKSMRMGRTKGLLEAPGSRLSLVEHNWKLVEEAVPEAQRFLVGSREEYEALHLPTLPDAREDSGPLAGIVSLLGEARRENVSRALVIACDLPYLTAALLRRLALEQPHASLLAPYLDDRFQPLFARYGTSLLPHFRKALDERRLGLQPLLGQNNPGILELSAAERRALRDWDTPEDMI